MTENRRIVLNIIATYGRTLFAIACGLLTGRWTLMALGEVDYGLYGVVGGMTAFVSFVSDLMASAVGRFYAFSTGQATVSGGEGIEICRKWFNTAFLVHTIVPVVLVLIGYPVGVWIVKSWLTIPADRVDDCVWVWRFVCLSCFVGMLTVPFRSMYAAKQYIAELTVYSVLQTAVNVVFLYYMVSHPGRWLMRFAAWSFLISLIPQLIICYRAMVVFEECRIRVSYLWDRPRLKELFVFAAYRFGGAFCMILSQQGMSLLVNKMIGPAKNAAMSVGSAVAGHSQSLAGSTSIAFYPVITKAAGCGDYERMRTLSFVTCKLAAALVLVFVLPLGLEIDEVLRIWLEKPPEGASVICVCLMINAVLENVTSGHYMTIFSVGKIKGYQISLSLGGLLAVVFAAVGLWLGCGILAVGVALVLSNVICVLVRLYFAQVVGGLSAWHWVVHVFIPLLTCSFIASCSGVVMQCLMPCSFLRVCMTTFAVEALLLPIMYFALFGEEERQYVSQKFGRIFHLASRR